MTKEKKPRVGAAATPLPGSPPSPTAAPRRGRRIAAVVSAVAVFAVAGSWLLTQWPTVSAPDVPAPAPPVASYVGGKACAECHAKANDAWHGSRHDLAMQVADEKSVLGNFANARFTYAGTTSTFSRRDGRFFVNTDGPDGKLADYDVKYTFGVIAAAAVPDRVSRRPHAGAGDRLGFAAEGGRRPALVPPLSGPEHQGRRPAALDRGRTRTGTTCAPSATRPTCARTSTPATNEFKTTWSELNVSCEACHGPGSNHVAWAKTKQDGEGLRRRRHGPRARARRAQGRDVAAGRRDRQRAAQRPAHRGARGRDVRALPRPREPDVRRLRARQAAARHAPALAARRRPVLERRADARRGLQLGLVRAEPDVREGRHLLRLPRSAHAGGARRATPCARSATSRRSTTRRRTRTTPPARPARRAPRATCRRRRTWSSIRGTITRCAFRGRTCRSKLGMPNACNNCHAKQIGAMGGGRDRQWTGEDAGRLPEFRRSAARRLGGRAGRARRAAGARRRQGAAGDRARQRDRPPRPLADADDARGRGRAR